jgi:ABC-2 type transport system permease protein
MIADLLTMMWKEWKEMLLQHGGIRSGILPMVIAPLGLLGVMLPWQMGRAWVESPLTLAVWAWMPLMLMSSLIADSFAGERERHTLETLLASRLPDRAILLGKVCAVVSYGWGLTMLGVLMGLLTVNLVHEQGQLLLYSWKFTLGILALSWLGSWLAAGAGVLVSLRAATVRRAQQFLMLAIMLLLFVPLYGFQLLPDEWRAQIAMTLAAGGAASLVLFIIVALTVVDISLIIAAMVRFRRARLILN